jgi:hypothetical protein
MRLKPDTSNHANADNATWKTNLLDCRLIAAQSMDRVIDTIVEDSPVTTQTDQNLAWSACWIAEVVRPRHHHFERENVPNMPYHRLILLHVLCALNEHHLRFTAAELLKVHLIYKVSYPPILKNLLKCWDLFQCFCWNLCYQNIKEQSTLAFAVGPQRPLPSAIDVQSRP